MGALQFYYSIYFINRKERERTTDHHHTLMAYVVAEISCAPHGEEMYPVPSTFRICRIFANATEAEAEFGQDAIYKAPIEYSGQDVYYVLYKLDEPLNLDRCIQPANTINNCGMWLSSEQRIYGDVSDLNVELVPPERLRARAREKAAAAKMARHKQRTTKSTSSKKVSYSNGNGGGGDDDDEEEIRTGYRGDNDDDEDDMGRHQHQSARSVTAIPGARYASPRSGSLWNKFA